MPAPGDVIKFEALDDISIVSLVMHLQPQTRGSRSMRCAYHLARDIRPDQEPRGRSGRRNGYWP
jgi:hypothetical protein